MQTAKKEGARAAGRAGTHHFVGERVAHGETLQVQLGGRVSVVV